MSSMGTSGEGPRGGRSPAPISPRRASPRSLPSLGSQLGQGSQRVFSGWCAPTVHG